MVVVDCCSWLLSIIVVGGGCQLSLLVVVVDCCRWWSLSIVVGGRRRWSS